MFLLSLASAFCLAASQEGDLREAYDVLAYELELAVDPDEQELSGTVVMTARVVGEELGVVQFDLTNTLVLESVTCSGAALAVRRDGDLVSCTLPESLARGAELALAIRYRGHPNAKDSFTGFHWARTPDGKPWINTSCQDTGSRAWWPGKDSYFHPEDKPERVALAITVPGELYAVSNGRLAETVELADGRKTYRWRHDYPLETYSVTLNVAPYVVVESALELPGHASAVPFFYYVLAEDAEKAAVQFAQVPRLMEVFCEAFGPFPFERSKFALVQTNFWGMEHSTAVAYGSSFPAWCEENGVADRYAGPNRFLDYILVHEVAHEWWGNAVSAATWGDFWIHEGFGTYAEGVYLERTESRARADEFFASQARHLGAKSKLFRGKGVNSGQAYSPVIYSKGACVLDTLRHFVDDDEAWWKAVREFNLRFRYGNATSDDFRAVVEETTGRDWKRFFDEWVYGEGYPKVSGVVRAEPGAIRLELVNQGSGETTFEVPLDLAWKANGMHESARVMVAPGAFHHAIDAEGDVTDLRVVHLERVLGRHAVTVER